MPPRAPRSRSTTAARKVSPARRTTTSPKKTPAARAGGAAAKKTVRRKTTRAEAPLVGVLPSGATFPRYEPSAVRGVRFVLASGRVIQWDGLPDDRLLETSEFQRVAVQWTYVVRNRRRWAEHADTIDGQARRAADLLRRLGLSERSRGQIAFAGHVEVQVPWTSEEVGWEVRIFPWEYVLTAGTRDLRRGTPLSVVRRLDTGGASRAIGTSPVVLYVESAAGRLADRFDFSIERRFVESSLPGAAFTPLLNPTRKDLEAAVATHSPDIVHLAGFDTHQGLTLLRRTSSADTLDGYLLRDEAGLPQPVPAATLAEALTAGTHPPALVTLNLHNTAGRVAPLLLSRGVGAALGFQDSFDDVLAEMFFNAFYGTLGAADGDLLLAFDRAWDALRSQEQSVQGSGLVLWSRASLLAQDVKAPAARAATRAAIGERLTREGAHVFDPATTPNPGEVVQLAIEPLKEANYALLHNDRGLFRQFHISMLKPGRLEQMLVNVELHAGADTYPYRRSFTLAHPGLDLNPLVRVPLTSALSRSRQEAMHTSLFVEVLWGPPGHARELYRDTHRITLLPVDQWRDDDADRKWLPSFVLPRDPAVAGIVDRAQRYLMALRDDPAAGFDGYQSLDPAADDPSEAVDLQVQALWSAILYDLRLAYINPPPAYARSEQRIRTPSEIVATGRGTCLDLTLLVAACLELVDIYPVVFLLEGHAFPGYWRSDAAHEAFAKVMGAADIDQDVEAEATHATRTTAQLDTWHLPKEMWPEMIQHVRSGDLVPLESVWLTTHQGFWDAVDAGHDNLKPRREFDSLIDIMLARGRRVTPLPIREEAS